MPERRKKKNLQSSKHQARKAHRAKSVSPKKATKVKKAMEAKAKKVASGKKKAGPVAHSGGTLTVHDANGKSLETMTLDPLFQDGVVNTDVIYQAVLMYQAGEREGTAATKDRGHVSGGGQKP